MTQNAVRGNLRRRSLRNRHQRIAAIGKHAGVYAFGGQAARNATHN